MPGETGRRRAHRDRQSGVNLVHPNHGIPEVIKVMRQQASPETLATFWNPRFPGQISSHLAIAEELAGNVINLEGHDLISVPLGFTDTASTTCLHVPSIGLIVAGDCASRKLRST